MLLEIEYKVIAIILHSRLLHIEESLDHEPQLVFVQVGVVWILFSP